jgi:hypothetical protein
MSSSARRAHGLLRNRSSLAATRRPPDDAPADSLRGAGFSSGPASPRSASRRKTKAVRSSSPFASRLKRRGIVCSLLESVQVARSAHQTPPEAAPDLLDEDEESAPAASSVAVRACAYSSLAQSSAAHSAAGPRAWPCCVGASSLLERKMVGRALLVLLENCELPTTGLIYPVCAQTPIQAPHNSQADDDDEGSKRAHFNTSEGIDARDWQTGRFSCAVARGATIEPRSLTSHPPVRTILRSLGAREQLAKTAIEMGHISSICGLAHKQICLAVTKQDRRHRLDWKFERGVSEQQTLCAEGTGFRVHLDHYCTCYRAR